LPNNRDIRNRSDGLNIVGSAAVHRAAMSIGPQERIRVARTHAEAKANGGLPGNYQDFARTGFRNEPGQPMISVVNDAIERTRRLTGMSRDEIVRRDLIRKEIPLYGGGRD
jgi:hypothetical protein